MAVTVVLLAAYRGARFLPEQLASLAGQRGADWRLVAGDDGSEDATPAILAAFAAAHPGRVEIVAGPRAGPAAHFRALLHRAGAADYAAYCDQDDVWDSDKLARAAAALARLPAERPALYAARVRYVDAERAPLGLSTVPRRPGFGHALVQNLAPGNTMVLNRAALALMQAAEAEAPAVPIHDWWTYQLVSGAGGAVIFDPDPVLDYRQHEANAIGTELGMLAFGRRMVRLAGGAKRRQLEAALPALAASGHRLTEANRARLEALRASLSTGSPGARLALLRASGARAATPAGDLALRAAALAGWG